MSEKFFDEQPKPSEIKRKMEGFTNWLEINLDNLEYNLKMIKERVGVEVMAVVKNNAYGHGLIPVVAFLEQLGVKWVMVAKFREAIDLRDREFELDILNMDVLFTDEQYQKVVKKGITQTIYTLESAEKLNQAAVSSNKKAKIFVKIDTGLNRVGVKSDKAVDLISKINKLSNIELKGIFSTFMQSSKHDKVMLDRLLNVAERVQKNGVKIPYRSMASSDAIMHNPEAWLDMVRPGIVLYGVYPEEKDRESTLELKQVLSMKGRLEHVKMVEKGETVTYFGRFTAPEKMQVGTLHLGFYDGIPREMANKGSIFFKGKYKSSIGSVSLNHYLVDLRGINASKGDVVTIIGEEGPNDIYNTAKTAGWMVYSLLNHLNPDIPRVYFSKGSPIALTQ
ncbi:alanine racemase [Candidatus Bathyarchaeota archaeon]|nr:alanine racemase [Candidatus Bathyarchaeota archaeon]